MTAPDSMSDMDQQLLTHCVERHGMEKKNAGAFTKHYQFILLRQTHYEVHAQASQDHVHNADGSVVDAK